MNRIFEKVVKFLSSKKIAIKVRNGVVMNFGAGSMKIFFFLFPLSPAVFSS